MRIAPKKNANGFAMKYAIPRRGRKKKRPEKRIERSRAQTVDDFERNRRIPENDRGQGASKQLDKERRSESRIESSSGVQARRRGDAETRGRGALETR